MVTRIGMMLPGAVSLGAYEGGALAAILKAVQASKGELVIDAIASASAGSITGLVASRAIMCGDDPVDLMRKIWVELPELKNLEKDAGVGAPLSMNGMIATAKDILGTEIDPAAHESAQKVPVKMAMALTALGGLTYSLVQKSSPTSNIVEPLQATTYVDTYQATMTHTSTKDEFATHMDGALASGSTPVGFPPRRLDRSADIAQYKANGILTPDDGHFEPWYSDGGDLDNQPLGRLLDLIAEIDNAAGTAPEWDRVIVMLNIEPAGPPSFEGTWFDTAQPTWLSTLLHVNHIRTTQSLYDDLRALEKTNQRISWIKEIAAALEGKVDEQIPALAESIAQQRANIDAQAGTTGTPPHPATTIEDLLRQAAGLEDKREIPVHVISPEIDPRVTLTPAEQLSGEFLFHFGGFLDAKFRESDFMLGYKDAQFWLASWLPGRVPDPSGVLDVVGGALTNPPWVPIDEGNASASSLSLSEKLQTVKLLAHIEHVIGHDIEQDVLHSFEGHDDGPPHPSIKRAMEQRAKAVLQAVRRHL